MAAYELTAERLREILEYDPKTGSFTWKYRPLSAFKCLRDQCAWNARFAGKAAGGLYSSGYPSIRIGRKSYLMHILAWLYVHGRWPDDQLDHHNCDRNDRRIDNLRDADHALNQQNRRIAPSNKKSGLPLGVSHNRWHGADNFKASIRADGKRITLGYYDTPELAHDAYVRAKRLLHRGCTI